MPTWMITGASGFLGRHLLAGLAAAARPGTRLTVPALARRPFEHPALDAFAVAALDDPAALRREIARRRPDVVFHLAGRTPPAAPAAFYQTNVQGTALLLDALQRADRPVRLVVAGSAAELGPTPIERLPIDETCPCRPVGPYGLSKWFATTLALRARPPLDVVVARIFNPIGPGLPASQAFGRYAARLAAATTGPGSGGPVRLDVRDLDARRDFIDARDVASALIALAVRGRAGRLYHVGRGEDHSVRDGLDRLIQLSGRRVLLEHRPGRDARGGPSVSRADVRLIERHTGWRPRIAWEQSLADLWDHLHARPCVRAGAGALRHVA